MPQRRHRHRKKKGQPEIPVGAFSDIAFLLIIFFLIVSTLSKSQGFISDIPAGEKSEAQSEENPTIQLHENRVVFNEVDLDTATLRRKLAELKLSEAADESDRIVLIEATGKVPYQTYFEAMAAVSEAGGLVAIVKEEEEEIVLHMKKRRHTKKGPVITVPVASMGDIAFLLIIFFMLCSRLAQENITLDPPEAPGIEELQETQITVAIDEAGTIYFQGRAASVKDVEWGVRAMVEGKTTARGKTVLFRCDRSLSHDKFEPVIEAIAKGGGLVAAVGDQHGE